ncbi:MAG: ABC transporter permease [Clostridia bacterium]|nr:ABC transporter permease [Clostridia bacterium]
MLLLIQYTLVFSSILTLVALGGCYSERSGIINIGLEGIMVIGGLGGILVLAYIPANLPAIVIFLAATLAAAICGMLYSLLLGVASINFKADQTLVGTALNMLGLALATVIVKALNIAKSGGSNVSARIIFKDTRPALLLVPNTEFNLFMILTIILLVAAFIVLYKTRFGLRLMSCGEHPQAAASVGISVAKMRYAGVLISGALGGIGGLVYIVSGGSEANFETGVMGFGFLALAVMIFGQWKPHRIALAALLFGLFRALANVYSVFGFLENLNIPSNIYNMLPYIICLIVLAFTSKKSLAPKAEGIPYDKSTR